MAVSGMAAGRKVRWHGKQSQKASAEEQGDKQIPVRQSSDCTEMDRETPIRRRGKLQTTFWKLWRTTVGREGWRDG